LLFFLNDSIFGEAKINNISEIKRLIREKIEKVFVNRETNAFYTCVKKVFPCFCYHCYH